MAKKYPAASDFPPGSQPWRRAIEAESKALRKEVDRLTREHEYTKVATNAAVANTGANAGRALGMLIGLGDTQPLILSVSTESYLTESGQPAAYIQITWEYDASDSGFDYADNGVQTELWARPVEAAPPLPDLDGEVIPGDPDLDSARVTAIAMPQTTGKIYKLECNTQYAVKIRQTSAVGAPGPYSDEMLITTPDEPDLRNIDPPILHDLGTGVGVEWAWQPHTDPPVTGYQEVVGFDATSVGITLDPGELMWHLATAANGKIYVHCTKPSGAFNESFTSRFFVINPDGTHASFDGSLLIRSFSSGTEYVDFSVNFATGPDGNLYGISTAKNTRSGSIPTVDTPYYKNIAYTPSASYTSIYEVIWKIDVSANTLSATPQDIDAGAPSGFYSYTYTTNQYSLYAPRRVVSHPDGVAHFYQSGSWGSSGTFGYRVYNTSTGASTWQAASTLALPPVPSGVTVGIPGVISYYSIAQLDDGRIVVPVTGDLGPSGDGRPNNASVYALIIVDMTAGTVVCYPLTNMPSSTNGVSITVSDNEIFAKGESVQQFYTVDPDGAGNYALTPISGGSYDASIETVVYGQYAFAPIYIDRGYRNGLRMIDLDSGYTYQQASGVNTHPVAWLTGDYTNITNNPGANSYRTGFKDSGINRSNFVSGSFDNGNVWTVSHAGVTLLETKIIPGVDSSPGGVVGPAKLWPEIKGVLIERLTPAGWVEVGSRITPGITFDPEPAGTHTYRFIPIGITNKIAPPTDSTSITI